MRRLLCTASIALFTFAGAAHAGELSADISTVLHDKLLAHADESVEIVRLGATPGSGSILYRHDSDQPMIPASNLKVVTTSAALDRLGPDFKFQTKLVEHNGDLILIGDGDPTFGDVELLSRVGWDVTTVFNNWAVAIKSSKLPAVRNVVVDDSIFESTLVHPRWPADQIQKRYMAPVAGLNLNANCIDVYVRTTEPGEAVRYVLNPPTQFMPVQNSCTTGGENAVWLSRNTVNNTLLLRGEARTSNQTPVSMPVQDPPLYAGTVLAETLQTAGIEHSGDVHRDRTMRQQFAAAAAAGDRSWILLAVHETPIAAVMSRANKDSMNLYAECLCKRLGAFSTGEAGSWENGPAATMAFLRKIGVPESQFHLDDGCGLSKQNGVSAHAMVSVLCYDYFGPNSKLFQSTLAIAGVDGTLDDRFRGTDLKGRVVGKSGFVNGVSCLSGFLHAKDGQAYAFSILMNGIPDKSNSGAKFLQEKIVRAVDADEMAAVSAAR